jgi:hypothetical protein
MPDDLETEARRFFTEDPDERRMFDHAAKLNGGPLRAIAAALTTMAQTAPRQGSYSKMLAIYANECARAADRASEGAVSLADPRWKPVPDNEHDYDGVVERSQDPRLPEL